MPLKTKRIALYLRVSTTDQGQASRTNAARAGSAMFQMLGNFAEFEREMILAHAKETLRRNGKFTSKTGVVRLRLGPPRTDPKKLRLARAELEKGTGILKTARIVGLGTGTCTSLSATWQPQARSRPAAFTPPTVVRSAMELAERAKGKEKERDTAMTRYHHYELASAAFQIGIVLASATSSCGRR